MPKEQRKRGKRAKKKAKEEDAFVVYAKPEEKAQHLATVTGTEYKPREEEQDEQAQASYGETGGPNHYDDALAYNDQAGAAAASTSKWPAVDPDTKAYFKQLETQIIEFEALHGTRLAQKAEQQGGFGGDEDEQDFDERVLLLRAALTQLEGNEAMLAADPEISPILERLVYSMDDFARRVLLDRFAGQYSDIAQDRFSSHVLQTLIVLGGGETVERERKGHIAAGPNNMGIEATSTEEGRLPTMTESIVALAKELVADMSTLVKSQQGSYILRALLLVLAGQPLPFDSQSAHGSKQSAISRSKKSAHWKSHRPGGEMRSFMASSIGKGKAPEKRIVPRIFEETLDDVFRAIDVALCGSKDVTSAASQQSMRISSDDPIATGLVQIMLEVEHDKGRSAVSGSLMDRLLQGLITASLEGELPTQPARSDFIETLMRSNISSHVLEKLIGLCPQDVFDLLFDTYFASRFGRLAGHPVANFVCARVVERINEKQTQTVIEEIPTALETIIENSRTGVLKALIDKSALFHVGEAALNKALLNAFEISQEDMQYLVPCALSLTTLKLFKRNPAYVDPSTKPEMQIQGSLLLQSWLQLKDCPVAESLLQMPSKRFLVLAGDPTASRVIDAFLDEENAAIAYKDRRNFLKGLIGQYQSLADDRIGSRVAERCWLVADPFLKDKIAESLLPHEMDLHGSYFGHFFIRKVNLPLYKRNKDEWKSRQARNVGGTPAELHAQAQNAPPIRAAPAAQRPQAVNTVPDDGESTGEGKKKRRKAKADAPDEIDQIFGTSKRAKVDGIVA